MSNQGYISITPSDSAPLPTLVSAIFVGGAGDVAVRSTFDTTPVTVHAAPAGKWLRLPHPILFVMESGTTASDLVGALALSTRETSGA
jgi:hypothetical protein